MKMESLLTQVLEFFQKTMTKTVSGSLAVCSNHSNVFIAGLSVSLNYTQSDLTLTLNCTYHWLASYHCHLEQGWSGNEQWKQLRI